MTSDGGGSTTSPDPARPGGVIFSNYELRHLAAHLEVGGRYVELHRLLSWETGATSNGWYLAKAGSGEVAGFLADVQRGWRAAREHRGGEPNECRAMEIRYALTAATLGSLAAAVPPALTVQLVSTGVWTLDEAVATARRVPDLEQRVESLIGVAGISDLDASEVDRVQQEALAGAEAIPDAYRRAGALARLSVNLPRDGQRRIYEAPGPPPDQVELVYSTGESESVPFTMDEASEPSSEADLVGQLIQAVPFLDGEDISRALAVAAGLAGELQRTLALARLVPRLMELGRVSDAEEAVRTLTITGYAEHARDRLRTVMGAGLSPLGALPPRWRAELLSDEIAASADPRAAAMDALSAASRLDDGVFIQSLTAAAERLAGVPHDQPATGSSEGSSAGARGVELEAIEDIEAGRYSEAMSRIAAIRDVVWRHAAAHEVAIQLASLDRVAEATEMIDLLPEPYWTTSLTGALAAASSQGAEAALAVVDGIDDPARRAACLAVVAVRTAGQQRLRALEAAVAALREGGDDHDRSQAIVDAALAGAESGRLLEVSQSLRHPAPRARALVGLNLVHQGSPDTVPSRSLAPLGELAPADRCGVDLDLVSVLPDQLGRCLLEDAARLMSGVADDVGLRNRLLIALGAAGDPSAATLADCWSRALEAAGRGDRATALTTCRALLALALRIGGADLLARSVAATSQVARWWP